MYAAARFIAGIPIFIPAGFVVAKFAVEGLIITPILTCGYA